MLKTLAKGAALAVLLTVLVACDNQDSKKPEVPPPRQNRL